MNDALRPEPRWMSRLWPLIRRLPRGRYWLADRLWGMGEPFATRLPPELGGLRYACDARDSKVRHVFVTGRYEPHETAIVSATLRPGATFVDVGANWGFFTLVAAARVGPTGRVVSFECDPRQFAILGRNVGLNELPNVRLLQVAAAAATGTLTLAGYDETASNWGLSKIVDAAPVGGTTFQVPARALDDVLDEEGVGDVDLLKMDIEGAEHFALQGMARGLERGRYRRIVLELHPAILAERGLGAKEVVDQLTTRGYRGWTIDHSPEASRRAAYAPGLLPLREFLSPFDPARPLDSWPHSFWLAPGVDDGEVSR